MKNRFISIVLSFMVILLCVPPNTTAHANLGTNVSGLIDQDTTWTAAGSPYSLSGNIHIANGVTLTVEPGVTIEGNGRNLIVYGNLEAVGRLDSKIKLNNVNIQPPAYSSYYERFLIHIENADISNGSLNPYIYSSYGNLILRDSKLFNLDAPVYISEPQSDVSIERNIFNDTYGIGISTFTGVKINILNNVFYHYKQYAVRNYKSVYNTEITVSYNSILTPKDQYTTALIIDNQAPSDSKMIATNNYWGTTDETLIEKMINDKIDDPRIGTYINFKPYLKSPDPNTPYLDLVKPVISGATDTTIKMNSIFDPMLGVFANDNVDGDITNKVIVSGYVDNTKPGRYTLTYTIEDIMGNKTSVSRNVTVVDDINPVISGIEDKSINITSNFNPIYGVTAMDNADGDITGKIIVTGTVDITRPGMYTLTYSVEDNSGNTTTGTRNITVIDNVKPVIYGLEDISINIGSNFDSFNGVTAIDNVDGDLTGKIITTGSVDTTHLGMYTLTYSVEDNSGNTTTGTRNIT
ncbi:DUF5011 domain-containing protein, partial [Neobacillus drentensis]|uniref:DUF5011 domain-containing protein n=1 Tax=Neobacillus drentensis TaxID=220684 RepID=UPI002FFFF2D2